MKTTKKTTIWALMLMLLTACSRSETVTTYEQEAVKQVVTQQSSIPVTFNTNAAWPAITRSAINTAQDLAHEGFSVFAYKTGSTGFVSTAETGSQPSQPNFMYNQLVNGTVTTKTVDDVEVEYVEGSYTPIKYWPYDANEKISFFAYAPHVPLFRNVNGAFVEYQYDTNAYRTELSSGIVAISKNDYGGVPYLIYKLDSNTNMDEMRDLMGADEVLNKSRNGDTYPEISFHFQHKLAGLSLGVCGVFNEENRGDNSGDNYMIDPDSYIRIEQIVVSAPLPNTGKLMMNDGTFTPVEGETTTTFTLDANNIADNLAYEPFSIDESEYIVDEENFDYNAERTYPHLEDEQIAEITGGKDPTDEMKLALCKAEMAAARQAVIDAYHDNMLSYGVGRYYAAIDDPDNSNNFTDGEPIPNKVEDGAIYQKVAMSGNADDGYVSNLFYFIPAGTNKSFTVKIIYHTLTRDPRMPYGFSDIKNVVQNTVTDVDLTDFTGEVLAINMQLGMTKVKINSVTAVDYYLSNEESTPYSSYFYYVVPK